MLMLVKVRTTPSITFSGERVGFFAMILAHPLFFGLPDPRCLHDLPQTGKGWSGRS
jgi:hypothetical protein